jgi:hypothetical protein
MKHLFLSILIAASAPAFADTVKKEAASPSGLTRAEVIRETLHAIRTGTMPDYEKPLTLASASDAAPVQAGSHDSKAAKK